MSEVRVNRVLFSLDTLSLGGAELSVLELIKNLEGFEIHVLVVYKAKHQLRPLFEDLGVNLYFLEIIDRFGFWKAIKSFRMLLREIRPDIVHATHFRTEVISRLSLLFSPIPLIGTLISDTYSKERYALVSSREKVKLEMYKWLNRATAFRSDLYISVSNAIVKPNMNYLWLKKSKILVIPNGRDVEYFKAARSYSKESLFPDIISSDKVIISNSRVIESKGFKEIFRAFQELHNRIGTFYLLIVGDGADISRYRKLADEGGFAHRVSFLGSRGDMPNLLKSADIFWFASHYEGSPGVIIEAMLSEIPIVASDIGPVTENLVDRQNAILFKKGDWRDLVSKTEYLTENWELRLRLVESAFALGVKKFDIKGVAERHAEVYRGLISSKYSGESTCH